MKYLILVTIACLLAFCVYKVLSNENEAEYIHIESNNDISKERSELRKAQQKIVELENRLASLEIALKEQMPNKPFDDVNFLNYQNRKRVLVTGGSGFVGSHLVDYLMKEGHEVVAVDNFFTGSKNNVRHWIGHPNFELISHDIVNSLFIEVDEIYHLASPASPIHYMYNPVKTIKTNTLGTINMLGLARRLGAKILIASTSATKTCEFIKGAKILIASTSEVYGNPDANHHPQEETYFGNVNPIGPRACYDEGKRVAETLSYAYAKQEKVDVRVARIFNTYGPRMHINDGRVVSNFISQALKAEAITIYGDGTQTRSFQYVSDLVEGLVKLMNSNYTLPVNLGNPQEHTILEFAEIIRELVGVESVEIQHSNSVEDDPQRRKPDITRAKKFINWEPKISLKKGLELTIDYFRTELQAQRFIERPRS